MTDRKAIDCVEAAKNIKGYFAYRTVGGYVCIIDNSTGDEVMFSDSAKKVESFIKKLVKQSISTSMQSIDADMERMMMHY